MKKQIERSLHVLFLVIFIFNTMVPSPAAAQAMQPPVQAAAPAKPVERTLPEQSAPSYYTPQTAPAAATPTASPTPRVPAHAAGGQLDFSLSAQSGAVQLNDTLTLTVDIHNTGRTAQTNIVFSDKLENGLEYVADSSSPVRYDSQKREVTYTLASLTAGESTSFSYQLKVTAKKNTGSKGEVRVHSAELSIAGRKPQTARVSFGVGTDLAGTQSHLAAFDSSNSWHKLGKVSVYMQPGTVSTDSVLVSSLLPATKGRRGPQVQFKLDVLKSAALTRDAQGAPGDQEAALVGASTEKFKKPAFITIDLTGDIDLRNIPAGQSLYVATYDETHQVWVKVPIVEKNLATNTVTVQAAHFSTWGAGIGSTLPQNGANVLLFDQPFTSLFTGSAQYSIPVWMPQGRNGMTPSVSLSYSSGGYNGVLGDVQAPWVGGGWNIDGTEIVRKIKTSDTGYGYLNGNDVDGTPAYALTVNGTKYDLIHNDDPLHPDLYNTSQSSFLYIRRHNLALGNAGAVPNTSGEWWEVVTTDGTHYRLGWNTDSEQLALMYGYSCTQGNPCLTPDGAYASLGYAGKAKDLVALRWRVDQVSDPHGNAMTYTYTEEQPDPTAQVAAFDRASYLDTISYTSTLDGGQPGYQVKFVTATRAGDGQPNAFNVWDNYDTKDLDQIKICYGTCAAGTLVRSYDLNYHAEAVPNSNGTLVLDNVAISGGSYTENGVSIPATDSATISFTYQNKDNRVVAGSELKYTYPRLASIQNGYGGSLTYTYDNDGRGLNSWYNWRVSNVNVQSGVTTSAVHAYTYATPVYSSTGELTGYTDVTDTTYQLDGATRIRAASHHFGTAYPDTGYELTTQSLDSDGTTVLNKTVNTYVNDDSKAPYENWHYRYLYQVENYIRSAGALVLTSMTRNHHDPATGNLAYREDFKGSTLYRKQYYEYLANFDPAVHILNKMTRALLVDANNAIFSDTRFHYDGGLNAAPVTGDLTLTQHVLGGTQTSDSSAEYDEYGNVVRSCTYAGYGTLNALPGGTCQASTTVYDSTLHTYPVQSTNALGFTSSTDYLYSLGLPYHTTDPNGWTSTTTYDGLGRTLSTTVPGLSQAGVKYTYPTPSGGSVTAPYSLKMEILDTYPTTDVYRAVWGIYDGMGRIIQSQVQNDDTGQLLVSDTAFNGLGLVKYQSTPYSATGTGGTYLTPDWGQLQQTVSSYDALGRIAQVTAPGNIISSTQYDGLTTTSFDPNGHKTVRISDAFGRMTQVQETKEDGTLYAATNYSYDVADRLLKVVDAQNNLTTLQYDLLGRKTSMNDPDMGIWSYQYDALGNLATQIDANSQAIDFYYDVLNRLKGKTYHASVTPATYHSPADPGSYTVTYTYGTDDGEKGMRTGMVDTSGHTSWDYSDFGRSVTETRTIGIDTPITKSSSTTSDWLGRPLTLTYPDGDTVTYHYDALGQAESMDSSAQGGKTLAELAYNLMGQIETTRLGNGATVSNTYDESGGTYRLLQRAAKDVNGASVMDFLYAYDPAGNITQVTDSKLGETTTYQYDSLDRLTFAQDAKSGGGYAYRQTYSYDKIGNLLQVDNGSTLALAPENKTVLAADNSPDKHGANDSLVSYKQPAGPARRHADTYSSQPDGMTGVDTYLEANAATTNYGTNTALVAGEANNGTNRYFVSIVKFDLSSIPANAVVNSATLYLTISSKALATNSLNTAVYRVKQNWFENQATWNVYSTGNNWQTGGGAGANDFDNSVSLGSLSVASTDTVGTEKAVTLNTSELQKLVDGTYVNYGWRIPNDGASDNAFSFYSSDDSTAGNRPRLVIDYTVPTSTPTLTPTVTPTATSTPTITPTYTPAAACAGTGVTREVWTGLSGSAVSNLVTGSNNFINAPNQVSLLTTSFEAPENDGDLYGQRLRALLCVPNDASYTFWITGDESASLRLNTTHLSSESGADWSALALGAVQIASLSSAAAAREWDHASSQKSAPVSLTTGFYYIEARMKENSGNDHLAVSWKVNDTSTPADGESAYIIPGSFLYPAAALNTATPVFTSTSGPTRTPTSTKTPTVTKTPTATPTKTNTPTVTPLPFVPVYSWNFDTTVEGWTVGNQVSGLAWQNYGNLGGSITGTDPFIYSATNLGYDINSSRMIKIRLQNGTASTTAQMFFITNADGGYNETKSKVFTLLANSNFTEYTLDMTGVSGWSGTLKQLRLDPSTATGSFSVDYIRVGIDHGPSPTPTRTSTVTPTPTNTQIPTLVGLWHMDEGSGSTVTDSSGHAHNGTLSGGARTANGAYNGAIRFSKEVFNIDSIQIGNLASGQFTAVKSWTFDTTVESWTASPNISGFVWQTGGFIAGNVIGSDPYITSPVNQNVAITSNNAIKIRLKNITSGSLGKFYFTTNADGTINEAKSKAFDVAVNSDFTDYTIDMSSVAGWTGTLNTLRFDPPGTSAGLTSVLVPYHSDLEPNNGLTVSAWVYIERLAAGLNTYTILNKGGTNQDYVLQVNSAGNIEFRMDDLITSTQETLTPTPTQQVFATGQRMPLNVWTMVTGVYDKAGGTLKLYVNGILVASKRVTGGTVNYDHTSGLYLGYTSNTWVGMMDEVRLYSGALKDSEVASLFGTFATPTPVATITLTATPSTATATATTLAASVLPWGTGNDGNLTITSGSFNINTQTQNSSRSCADGVAYNVTSLGSTVANISMTNTPTPTPTPTGVGATPTPTGCLNPGDEVMLINLQGTTSSTYGTGNYEFLHVAAVSGTQVAFTTQKTKFYGTSFQSDAGVGTGATNQKVMLVRVPNYSNVTVSYPGILTANAWDGLKGGLLVFRASGTLSGNGTLQMSGLGYRGTNGSGTNMCGETYIGFGSTDACYGGGETGDDSGGPTSGGGAYGTNGGGGSGGHEGGTLYGSATLDKLYFGSAAGYGMGSQGGAPGGSGGGIVLLAASTINFSGAIRNDGAAGYPAGKGASSGAGGSIRVEGNTISTLSSVTANSTYGGAYVSLGGVGRIAVYYQTSLAGLSSSPGAYQARLGQGPTNTPTPTAITYPNGQNWGNGADGPLSISTGTFNISTQNSGTRSCADGGDGVAYYVTSLASNNAQLYSGISTGCLKVGDEIMLINAQGVATNYANTGNYEFLRVGGISGNRVDFVTLKTLYYGANAGDDSNIGVSAGQQHVLLVRVPNYSNVTVSSPGILTASAWDGWEGGMLAFRASGTLSGNGTLQMTGLGYRGTNGPGTNLCGESYIGFGSTDACYGAGETGDDSGGPNSGGGAYGTNGGPGNFQHEGGVAYGAAPLDKLYFGSAAGYGMGSGGGMPGGKGGGILYLAANTINFSGGIYADGTNSGPTPKGAGSGAGGSIRIEGNTISALSSVTANSQPSTNVAPGGVGRIAVYYWTSLAGLSASPAAYQAHLGVAATTTPTPTITPTAAMQVNPGTTNLVSWWSLDEAGGTRSDSHGTNSLTDNNTVASAAGKNLNAADFEADNSEFLEKADNASLSTGSQSFSIAAWVKMESKPASYTMLVSKYESISVGEYILTYSGTGNGDKFYFQLFNSSGTIICTAFATNLGAPAAGVWYYLVGWYDSAAQTCNIQVNNGIANWGTVTTGQAPADTSANFRIGAYQTTESLFFDGLVDEVAFYKKALTAGEIAWLYNNGTGRSYADLAPANPGTTNLVSWWSMDETSGSRNDSYGSNTLTDNNTVTSISGKKSNAGQFTLANSEYLSIADNASLSMGAGARMTVCTWVKLDTKSTVQNILTKAGATTGTYEYFLLYDSSNDRFWYRASSNGTAATSVDASSFGSPSINTWYFVCGGYDGSNVWISVNNGARNTVSYSGDIYDGSTSTLYAGGGAYKLNGALDEALLYKRSLSLAEVAWLYNNGIGRSYGDLGNTPTKLSYTYSGSHPHAVAAVADLNHPTATPNSYSYDLNGNMSARTVDGVTTTFSYNADNRPASIVNTSGPTLSVASLYDGDGTRVAQIIDTGSGPVLSAFFMGGSYEVTVSSTGTQTGWKKYYSVGGQTIMDSSAGGGLQYILSDQQGSAVGLLDSSGTLISEQRYLPFGGVRTNLGSTISQTDFGYTGQRNIASLGLMDYKARFYDPYLNRFIQPDTVVSNPVNPQTWNRYSYVSNNPIRFTDPSGHSGCNPVTDPNHCQSGGGDPLKNPTKKADKDDNTFQTLVRGCKGRRTYSDVDCHSLQQELMQKQASAIQHWLATALGSITSGSGASPARIVWNASTGQYRDLYTGRFVSPKDPDFPWPSYPGLDTQTRVTLPERFTLSRLGDLGGRFASLPGTSASGRGMPLGADDMPETLLRVIKPLEVTTGPTTGVPEFGAAGGGEGFVFDSPIETYIPEFLEILP